MGSGLGRVWLVVRVHWGGGNNLKCHKCLFIQVFSIFPQKCMPFYYAIFEFKIKKNQYFTTI